MAFDLAVALGLPFKRTSRLQRARREICDEQRETEAQKAIRGQSEAPAKRLQG